MGGPKHEGKKSRKGVVAQLKCRAIEISQIEKSCRWDVAQMKVAQLKCRSIEMSCSWDVDQMKSRAIEMSRKKKSRKSR